MFSMLRYKRNGGAMGEGGKSERMRRAGGGAGEGYGFAVLQIVLKSFMYY